MQYPHRRERTGTASIIIAGGPTKEAVTPPNPTILEKHGSHLEAPFNPDNEQDIIDYIRYKMPEHANKGYFRVYSPGHRKRFREYFKGFIHKHPEQQVDPEDYYDNPDPEPDQ